MVAPRRSKKSMRRKRVRPRCYFSAIAHTPPIHVPSEMRDAMPRYEDIGARPSAIHAVATDRRVPPVFFFFFFFFFFALRYYHDALPAQQRCCSAAICAMLAPRGGRYAWCSCKKKEVQRQTCARSSRCR